MIYLALNSANDNDINSHTVSLVFTDGMEQVPNSRKDSRHFTPLINQKLNDLSKKPPVICVGASGNTDKALLEKIARETGCTCIHLGADLDQFSDIALKAKQYAEPHALFKLLIQNSQEHVNNIQKNILVKDGTLRLVKNTVYPFRKNIIVINQQPLELEPQQAPSATNQPTPTLSSFWNLFGRTSSDTKKSAPQLKT